MTFALLASLHTHLEGEGFDLVVHDLGEAKGEHQQHQQLAVHGAQGDPQVRAVMSSNRKSNVPERMDAYEGLQWLPPLPEGPAEWVAVLSPAPPPSAPAPAPPGGGGGAALAGPGAGLALSPSSPSGAPAPAAAVAAAALGGARRRHDGDAGSLLALLLLLIAVAVVAVFAPAPAAAPASSLRSRR